MRVLFVCTGNICRSSTAEAIARHLARQHGLQDWHFASCGTHDYHVGKTPDKRSVAEAARYGVDMTAQRAQQLQHRHFSSHDLVLAMTDEHLRAVQRLKPAGSNAACALFTDYTGIDGDADIADPYYGDAAGFTAVYQRLEQGCRALLSLS